MTWYSACSWLDVDAFGITCSSNRSQEELGHLNLIPNLVPGGSGKHPNGVLGPLLGLFWGRFGVQNGRKNGIKEW